MELNLSKLWEIVKDSGADVLQFMGSWRASYLAAEQQQGEVMTARVTLHVLKSVLQERNSLVTILALYIGWFKYL